MRARALALLALLAAPALAGCLGARTDEEGPRLAAPTDTPALPPVVDYSNATRPAVAANLSDPGYRMDSRWRVGDAWDYVSETTPAYYASQRVREVVQEGGRTFYRLDEAYGLYGNPPSGRLSVWIDGDNWTRLNATDTRGGVTRYDPGAPMRYVRNGTFAFNATGPSIEQRVVTNSWYATNREMVTLPWGQVQAARVEHRAVTIEDGQITRRTLVVLYASDEYANHVAYRDEHNTRYVLHAARVGERAYGQLIAV